MENTIANIRILDVIRLAFRLVLSAGKLSLPLVPSQDYVL
jgi:hypothetical protein